MERIMSGMALGALERIMPGVAATAADVAVGRDSLAAAQEPMFGMGAFSGHMRAEDILARTYSIQEQKFALSQSQGGGAAMCLSVLLARDAGAPSPSARRNDGKKAKRRTRQIALDAAEAGKLKSKNRLSTRPQSGRSKSQAQHRGAGHASRRGGGGDTTTGFACQKQKQHVAEGVPPEPYKAAGAAPSQLPAFGAGLPFGAHQTRELIADGGGRELAQRTHFQAARDGYLCSRCDVCKCRGGYGQKEWKKTKGSNVHTMVCQHCLGKEDRKLCPRGVLCPKSACKLSHPGSPFQAASAMPKPAFAKQGPAKNSKGSGAGHDRATAAPHAATQPGSGPVRRHHAAKSFDGPPAAAPLPSLVPPPPEPPLEPEQPQLESESEPEPEPEPEPDPDPDRNVVAAEEPNSKKQRREEKQGEQQEQLEPQEEQRKHDSASPMPPDGHDDEDGGLPSDDAASLCSSDDDVPAIEELCDGSDDDDDDRRYTPAAWSATRRGSDSTLEIDRRRHDLRMWEEFNAAEEEEQEEQAEEEPWSVQAVAEAAAEGEDSLLRALQHFEKQFHLEQQRQEQEFPLSSTVAKWGGVDHVNESGMTALVFAAAGLLGDRGRQKRAIQSMLNCGAQVDKHCQGRSAYLCAQALGQSHAILMLSGERKKLRTLAVRATRAGRTAEVLTWLRETWPSPLNDSAFCGSYGYTPFCLACEAGHVELVEQLLTMEEMDPSITNHVRLSGWDCARRCGRTEVCDLLQGWSEICDARATKTSRKLREERQRWEKDQAAGFVTPIVDLNVDFERLKKLEARSANQSMLRRLERLESGEGAGHTDQEGEAELRRTITGSCSCIACVNSRSSIISPPQQQPPPSPEFDEGATDAAPVQQGGATAAVIEANTDADANDDAGTDTGDINDRIVSSASAPPKLSSAATEDTVAPTAHQSEEQEEEEEAEQSEVLASWATWELDREAPAAATAAATPPSDDDSCGLHPPPVATTGGWSSLNEGQNGKVWRVEDIFPPLYSGPSGAPYTTCAVKSVKLRGMATSSISAKSGLFSAMLGGSGGAGSLSKDEEMQALTEEIKILQAMSHPNIVKTLGHSFGAPPDNPAVIGHMLLLELCDCDLGSLIAGNEGVLSWTEWLRLATEMAAGLAYIHTWDGSGYGVGGTVHGRKNGGGITNRGWSRGGIAHLDLKPGNVLIKKRFHCHGASCSGGLTREVGQVKLADFGAQFDTTSSTVTSSFSRQSTGSTPRSPAGHAALSRPGQDARQQPGEEREEGEDTPFGSFEYMAPEAWHRKHGYPGQHSDTFSFGVILWEIYAKRRPYTGLEGSPHETMRQVTGDDGVEYDDLSVVPGWYAQGFRPHFPALQSAPSTTAAGIVANREDVPIPFPPAWRLLAEACWLEATEVRPTFPQLERALKLLRSANDGEWAAEAQLVAEPEPSERDGQQQQGEDTTKDGKGGQRVLARGWLRALGYLSDAQIDEAVAYAQEEGEPRALVEMDAEDFAEMVEEMTLGDDEAKFRANVASLRQQLSPTPATQQDSGGQVDGDGGDSVEETAAALPLLPENRRWVELLALLEDYGVDPQKVARLRATQHERQLHYQQQQRQLAPDGTHATIMRLETENEALLAENTQLKAELAKLRGMRS